VTRGATACTKLGAMVEVIGFDCDDTLWESESTFVLTQRRVHDLLAPHVDPAVLAARLLDVQRANLDLYGYGAKAFTLSLIETALELAGDRLSAGDVRGLLDAGKEILGHPVELLAGAREAVEAAVDSGLRVVLITKGDLFHQESKVARSGLGDLVDAVEVIAEKDEPTYRRVLRRHSVDPARFVMVGNSLRSDVAPVLALGGWAAHVPHELTWALERVEDESVFAVEPRFRSMASLAEVRPWIDELIGQSGEDASTQRVPV
jgi:putative hydrolase of the HAD superfamily